MGVSGMPIRNSITLAVASLFLATALPVIAECSPAPTQTPNNNRLSPEQQAMMFMDAHDKLRSMSPDQRKAYKKQLRQQWASLSPAQKAQQQQQFDSEWNALPQAKKDKVEARIQQQAAKRAGEQNQPPDSGEQ
jgi:hypothetical protein